MQRKTKSSKKAGNYLRSTRRRRTTTRSSKLTTENRLILLFGTVIFIIGSSLIYYEYQIIQDEQEKQRLTRLGAKKHTTTTTTATIGNDLIFDPNQKKKRESFLSTLRSPIKINTMEEEMPMVKVKEDDMLSMLQQQPPLLPPHLDPIVPYLPIFPDIPNAETLIQNVLSGTKPTIAGIIALLQHFLSDLHDQNMQLSAKQASGPQIIQTFFTLATQHLLPFDKIYRQKEIFPIREDESIFLSLASFREHLLADTLMYAFDNAKHPDKLFIGAVVQNCFGKVYSNGTIDPSGTPCKTGLEVIGKNEKGRDMTKMSDAPVDKNGIEEFCKQEKYHQFCTNGQIRVLYVHESEALGPAMARYYASKLWGGETYFIQTDSHLQFAVEWDDKYRKEMKACKSFPKVVLSSYPPGFNPGNKNTVRESNGARLCHCETNKLDPNPIIRINTGSSYNGIEESPTQIPFIAAGFFFTRAEFLVDVPFDPFIPWCFMGEEIALSLRAWTHGWDIYAPRKNLIAHQYRPGRMGLPKFWECVAKLYKRPGMNNELQKPVIKRIKNLAAYPTASDEKIKQEGHEFVLIDKEYYGLGSERTREEYMEFAGISIDYEAGALTCTPIRWCNRGLKD